jgi:23S rRNA (guanine745-N1)-methyltransferase
MMKTLTEKKIDIAKRTVETNIDFLHCPLCRTSFGLIENGMPRAAALKCQNSHTYDISRKGYVNLFNGYTKIVKTYDKKLFTARQIISDAGLYSGLCKKLSEIIKPGVILDAGCGCGNLTLDIFKNIGKPVTFAVDLSKDGIDFAATNFCEDNLLWIVGNLNNLPLADNKIDVILNIMSPANYAEFIRVLKHDGVLLKVLPDADYLKELRHFIYKESDKNEYSNKDVLSNLEENMTVNDIIDVKYTHTVLAEHIPALFDMTPLTSNINERDKIRDELIGKNDFEVTLAFKIAVCKNR